MNTTAKPTLAPYAQEYIDFIASADENTTEEQMEEATRKYLDGSNAAADARREELGYMKPGQPNKEDKGKFNGSCNVTACQQPRATVYMPQTHLHNGGYYYCARCARNMMEFDNSVIAREPLAENMRQYRPFGCDYRMRFPLGLFGDYEDRNGKPYPGSPEWMKTAPPMRKRMLMFSHLKLSERTLIANRVGLAHPDDGLHARSDHDRMVAWLSRLTDATTPHWSAMVVEFTERELRGGNNDGRPD